MAVGKCTLLENSDEKVLHLCSHFNWESFLFLLLFLLKQMIGPNTMFYIGSLFTVKWDTCEINYN